MKNRILAYSALVVVVSLLLMLARGVGLVGEAYYRRDRLRADSGAPQDFDSRTIGARFGIAAFVF